MKLDMLDFEIIRVPEQYKRYEEIKPIISYIGYKSDPDTFAKDEEFVPFQYISDMGTPLENIVIIIGYYKSEPVVFMFLLDKNEMDNNINIGRENTIKHGGEDNDSPAWYLLYLYGLHEQYSGMGRLIIKFFEDNLLKEKTYAYATSHLTSFFGWNQISTFKKTRNNEIFNYKIIA